MLELLTDPAAWVSFLTLTVLEIVLGIDNIIFLSILVSRLPKALQQRARLLGLAFAMLTRIALLFSITWLVRLTTPWFTVLGEEISGRDLILLIGGLFLLVKSVNEIHSALEGPEQPLGHGVRLRSQVTAVIVQIGLIDIVFSLDSVFTAIGLAQHVEIMVAAIVLAVLVMMLLARPISEFVDRHPTIKVLALAFLILIGVALVAESLDFEIPKGYLYFAMAFSIGVEMINLRIRRRGQPVGLHAGPRAPGAPPPGG
ncbi:MAG: TerC family protein [Gammaproteobacteria bacterium]|nr:TerC family protein [Gammaproteobacteria bacterium]